MRQELIRFPIALWVEAGLEGGVKSAAWSRGCDESQEKADGRSIFWGARNAPEFSLAGSQISCVVVEGPRIYVRRPSDRGVGGGAQSVCDK